MHTSSKVFRLPRERIAAYEAGGVDVKTLAQETGRSEKAIRAALKRAGCHGPVCGWTEAEYFDACRRGIKTPMDLANDLSLPLDTVRANLKAAGVDWAQAVANRTGLAADVVRDYEAGKISQKEIAATLGITRAAVQARFASAGVDTKAACSAFMKLKLNGSAAVAARHAWHAQVIATYYGGASTRVTGEIHNITEARVCQILKQHNFALRPSQPVRKDNRFVGSAEAKSVC